MKRRKVEIAVLSDIHLGTYGCHANECNNYLKSIDPEILILNGDIIDFWAFKKSFWPKEHTQLLRQILRLVTKGKQIYYLTGNHDDTLRKFSDFSLGNFHLLDKVVLDVDDTKVWLFHGDIFDASINHAKWLAKLGGWGYDLLILFNRFVNRIAMSMGRKKYSFSKKIKESVKKAIKFIGDFEQSAIDLAIQNNYHVVACGHIHVPTKREYSNKKGSVLYLNSGDWVENLTSLEYNNGTWSIYEYMKDTLVNTAKPEDIPDHETENEAEVERQLNDIINKVS